MLQNRLKLIHVTQYSQLFDQFSFEKNNISDPLYNSGSHNDDSANDVGLPHHTLSGPTNCYRVSFPIPHCV